MSNTMSQNMVNLGLQVVNEEIDQALEVYPNQYCKKVFAMPDWRQKLIDYVMGSMPETYVHEEYTRKKAIKTKFPYYSLELRLRVEKYVHWGIEYILATNPDLVKQPLNSKAQVKREALSF